MNQKANPIHPAPIMRFLVELTTWIWLLMSSLGLTIIQVPYPVWFFPFLLAISIVMLSQLNFPGDKKAHGKMVSGKVRIFVEIFSAFLGLISARIVFDLLGLYLQLILSLISFYLDRDRWKWFLERNEGPPDYVIALGISYLQS